MDQQYIVFFEWTSFSPDSIGWYNVLFSSSNLRYYFGFIKCSMYNICSSSWWLDWLHLQGANHILHSLMISFAANLHHTSVPTIFFLISMKSWGADILRQNSFLSKIEILKFAQLPLRQANFCVSCSSSFKFLTTFSHRPQLPSVELFFPDKDVFSTKKISMWMKKSVVDILLLPQHLTKYVFLWHNIALSDWIGRNNLTMADYVFRIEYVHLLNQCIRVFF